MEVLVSQVSAALDVPAFLQAECLLSCEASNILFSQFKLSYCSVLFLPESFGSSPYRFCTFKC